MIKCKNFSFFGHVFTAQMNMIILTCSIQVDGWVTGMKLISNKKSRNGVPECQNTVKKKGKK